MLFALAALPISVAGAAAPEPAPVRLVQDLAATRSGLYVVEPHHTRVVWKVSHHGFSTFQALLPEIAGTLLLDAARIENSRLDVTINMRAATSGIPVFDERMADPSWNIFSSRTYPQATFRSTRVTRRDARRFSVTGELTFLGVTRPLTLEAAFNQAGSGLGQPAGYRVGFDATALMKRGDWGSTSISTLGDEVHLEIEAEFLMKE